MNETRLRHFAFVCAVLACVGLAGVIGVAVIRYGATVPLGGMLLIVTSQLVSLARRQQR